MCHSARRRLVSTRTGLGRVKARRRAGHAVVRRGGRGGRQREPHQWSSPTVRTVRAVDPRDLVPPLDHTPGTAWGWLGRRAQPCPTATQGPRLGPVGEEARVPQPQAAVGPDRPQAAPDTCVSIARHGRHAIAWTTVAVGAAAPPVTHVEAPMMGQSNARPIAAERVQDLSRTGKRCRGGDDPLCGIERCAQRLAALRRAQRWRPYCEGPGATGAGLGQRRAALAAQDRAQGAHRQEETGIGRHPARPRGGEGPCRDETVDMHMRSQGLRPGMPDHGTPELPAEVAAPTRHERLTRRLEQQGAQWSLVREAAGVKLRGDGQPQVDRGPRQERGLTGFHPLDRGTGLALRAVPMAAGMRRVSREAPGGTVCSVPPERRCPAGLKSVPHLLRRGWYGRRPAGGLAIKAKDIGAFPRCGAGMAQSGRLWASGGRRWPGMTPAWPGVAPRRAGGRTGCGPSPEAGG